MPNNKVNGCFIILQLHKENSWLKWELFSLKAQKVKLPSPFVTSSFKEKPKKLSCIHFWFLSSLLLNDSFQRGVALFCSIIKEGKWLLIIFVWHSHTKSHQIWLTMELRNGSFLLFCIWQEATDRFTCPYKSKINKRSTDRHTGFCRGALHVQLSKLGIELWQYRVSFLAWAFLYRFQIHTTLIKICHKP